VYVAWVEHRDNRADVQVQRFDANGKALREPVRVNPQSGEATAWRGDPPTLAVSTDGVLYVGWTKIASSPTGHAADIYLSQSHNAGATFDAPVKVNDDQRPAVHGMHSLAVAPDRSVYMAWLDERNVAPPPPMPSSSVSEHHHMESNREVFLAVSKDGGRSFGSNRRIATDVCPCCKTTIAVSPDNRVYVSWRQVLPGDFRHIAVASSSDQGESFSQPVTVSDDRWSIGGCPVSGAALSVGSSGVLDVLWYTAGDAGPEGLYWSQSRDGGRTFEPRKLVYEGRPQGTPSLIAETNDELYAVWEEDSAAPSPILMLRKLPTGSTPVAPIILSTRSSLPNAVVKNGRLYFAYVNGTGDKRAVIFQTTPLTEASTASQSSFAE
jgi:hypothetical protein